MTTELTYLAWTLVLAAVQILAFDIARTRQYGTKWNTGARDGDMPPLKPMVGRLQRAQNNLFETLPLFIAAVLVSNLGHRDSATMVVLRLSIWHSFGSSLHCNCTRGEVINVIDYQGDERM